METGCGVMIVCWNQCFLEPVQWHGGVKRVGESMYR